jgi:hypothetical protein
MLLGYSLEYLHNVWATVSRCKLNVRINDTQGIQGICA